MRPLARAVVLTAVTALAVGGLAAPATAASPVISSADPAPNQVLDVDPDGVTLIFDQQLTGFSTISVSGPSGTCVKDSPIVLPSPQLSCTFLPGGLTDGTYTVTYSADPDSGSDPVTPGSYDFVLDSVAPAAPSGVSIAPDPYTALSTTLTVTGTSESDDDTVEVEVTDGAATLTQTVDAGAGGGFSATFTASQVAGLADGTLTATARSTDLAGNEGPAGSDTSTKDSTPPGTPTVVISPDPINAANQGAVTVSGTSNGTTVDVALGDGPGGVADLTQNDVAVVAGSYSATFNATSLPDGTITATVVATDTTGNDSGAGTDTAIKDTVPPGTPTVVISPDPINAANQGTVTVSGTSNGTSVSITVSDGAGGGADLVQTATVSGGTYSKTFNVSSLSDGTITATVGATDAAGNNSSSAGTDTALKDTLPPGTPTVVISPDPINAANQGTVTVSGTSNGTSVSITVSDGAGGGADLVQTVAVSGGTYSKTFDVSSLSDGVITATVVATDAAGNTSAPGTDTATKDTVPPGTPTVVISPDPINAANQGTVTVSGTSNGTSVSITVSDGAGGGADLVATVSVSGGTYSKVFDVSSLADGTITATVVATDDGGNPSGTGTDTATKDTAPPGTPTAVISPDPINAANETSVTVSGTSNGTSVSITVSDGAGGGADLVQTVAVSGGTYSKTFDVSTLSDGTITATVVASDAAGNHSGTGTDTATKDTVPPGTPTALISPDPINAANQGAVTVSGAVSGAASVTITVSDGAGGGADLVQTVAVSGGTYSKVFNVSTLVDGAIAATVVASDAAGNTGAPGTDTATKDTVPPGTPTVLISPDPINALTQTAVTVSGTSNGDSVNITVSDGAGGGADLVSTVAVSGGTYSKVFNVSTLVDGPIAATVVASDAAGNTSAPGTDTATKDTVPPGTPTVLISPDPINNAAKNAVTVAGTVTGAAASVTITVSDGPGGGADIVQTATVSGGGYTKTLSVATLSDGTITATVVATDAAGNVGGPGTGTATKDTGAPPAPTVQISPDPVNIASVTAVTVSGAAEGVSVSITMSDGQGGAPDIVQTATVSGGGSYSKTFDVTSLDEDGITASVAALDAAGNKGTPGFDLATKDTVAPTRTASLPAEGSRVLPPATVVVTFSESLASGSIAIPGVPGTSTRSGSTVTFTPATTPMPEGTLTATATVTDLRGNPGTGTVSFIVDDGFATTATTLNPLPAAVSYQKPIKLSGQVTRSDKSVAALPVMVVMRDDAGRTSEIALVTPSPSGAWSLQYRPTVNGTYTATYLGDRKNAASTSAGRTTRVRVAIEAGTATGPASKKATVKGSVTPAKTGAVIQLYRVGKGGKKLLGTVKVKGGGRFTFKVRLPKGKTKLQVSIGATSGNLGGSDRLTAFRT